MHLAAVVGVLYGNYVANSTYSGEPKLPACAFLEGLEAEEGAEVLTPRPSYAESALCRGDLAPSLLRVGALGRVDYRSAVLDVALERLLGHAFLLALVLHKDLASMLEETLRGLLRDELDLGLAGFTGGQSGGVRVRGPLRQDAALEHVDPPVVVDDVAVLAAADVYDVLLALLGVDLVYAEAAA